MMIRRTPETGFPDLPPGINCLVGTGGDPPCHDHRWIHSQNGSHVSEYRCLLAWNSRGIVVPFDAKDVSRYCGAAAILVVKYFTTGKVTIGRKIIAMDTELPQHINTSWKRAKLKNEYGEDILRIKSTYLYCDRFHPVCEFTELPESFPPPE